MLQRSRWVRAASKPSSPGRGDHKAQSGIAERRKSHDDGSLHRVELSVIDVHMDHVLVVHYRNSRIQLQNSPANGQETKSAMFE